MREIRVSFRVCRQSMAALIRADIVCGSLGPDRALEVPEASAERQAPVASRTACFDVEIAGGGGDEQRIGVDRDAEFVGVVRAALGEIVVAVGIAVREVMVNLNPASMGIPRVNGVVGVLVEDIVFDE